MKQEDEAMRIICATAICGILTFLFFGFVVVAIFANTNMRLQQAIETDTTREINTRSDLQSVRMAHVRSHFWNQPPVNEEGSTDSSKVYGWRTYVIPAP